MGTIPTQTFECHMYVPAHGRMTFKLPPESGPKQVVRLQPLGYDQLVDPKFRRLLAAFESLPSSLAVQV